MPPKHTANPWSFPPGTPVEISSNDDGFVGSWYVGRVLTANGNEYSVQYETLVSDLDPNEPLLETLKLSQLRQVPPRETLRDFRVGDQVDAFYKAGWWEGVVTDVLGNGRFGVFFRASKEQNELTATFLGNGSQELSNTREEKGSEATSATEVKVSQSRSAAEVKSSEATSEVKASQARLAAEVKSSEATSTAKGKASETTSITKVKTRQATSITKVKTRRARSTADVKSSEAMSTTKVKASETASTTKRKASEATAITEEIFSKGTLVEVSIDEDGLRGSWFAATIVKAVGKDKFLVEYQSLRTDDDSGFLREEIDSRHVRPYPPETLVIDCFNLFEEVDAFYNDGWWVGVISKVRIGPKYLVYFEDTDDEREFEHSDLRPHQDWIDGKWVRAHRDHPAKEALMVTRFVRSGVHLAAHARGIFARSSLFVCIFCRLYLSSRQFQALFPVDLMATALAISSPSNAASSRKKVILSELIVALVVFYLVEAAITMSYDHMVSRPLWSLFCLGCDQALEDHPAKEALMVTRFVRSGVHLAAHARGIFARSSLFVCIFCRLYLSSRQFQALFPVDLMATALAISSPSNAASSRKKVILSELIVALVVFYLVEAAITMSYDHMVSRPLWSLFCLGCDQALEVSLYCVPIFMANMYSVLALMIGLWLSYGPCGYLWSWYL
ncbi:Late embryogenesis abundant protein 76 [Morella rubra]|uniref:Late embryogenesis abundant protein 76 n=1 Tax=Morella rubra TaxID=262757 RepID=A0A6A1UJQ2_9ROSI|nr:Late embryogenesis abundant protein 76 [Morella rubra]